MTTTAPLVRGDTDRGVAVLTLDSPHNRNALSAALIGELGAALKELGKDPAVRAVLLTHTGPAFSAGADLKAAADPAGAAAAKGSDLARGPELLVKLMRRIATLPKPVVARVDGHARAGGLGLLAACDLSVATEAATFAFTESRLGLAPSVASLPVLEKVDPQAAARYFLTGETFGAAEAVRIGLVTAPAEELDGMLDGLRAASPQGLRASKELVTGRLRETLALAADSRIRHSARLFRSAEAAEGIRALLERRKPPWAL